MTRMVSQILWEHCMGELGYGGNDYKNDTFAVRSYNWVDEDANDWHFWHKPSGLKIRWYKYPLRGFEANIEITDDQFLDVLHDCTNSMEDGKAVRFLHDIHKWWEDCKTEQINCSTCRFNNRYGNESMCSTCARHYSDSYQPKIKLQTNAIDMALIECRVQHNGCKNCNKACVWRNEE